ncbi:MAG: proline--tRNA ligase [Thermoplasmata archaeon]|nr:proline--tRNA ligase [Thermoplasmata archaeon]
MAELPDKRGAFFDWYLEVIEAAQLTDKRYPVKGLNVWTPYGFRARRQLDAVLVREIEATKSEPVEFPALIPETEFRKEGDHIKGFDAQVYWVTRGGSTPLDVPLVLRPTSETAMYPIFALWVRSHQDLPLNVYQIVNTFRYETKTTRPFLRVREIHFFEEHTCQIDDAAASARVASNLAAFEKMAHAFDLPFLAVRRPEWDKFPGAHYTIALDIPLGEGRTLQIGSIHHYRENFSRPYGIQYEDRDGTQRFAHQTTFGLSERLVGAIVATHGDAQGVVFPSEIAPYSVVIIPVLSAKSTADPRPVAAEVAERLTAAGCRVHLDDGEGRPGAKYYYWETRGVPLRIEIGGREATERFVTVASRLGEKERVDLATLEIDIGRALERFDATLRVKAHEAYLQAFELALTLETVRKREKIYLISWCGQEACGHEVENAVDGALLGVLEGEPPIPVPDLPGCVACGRDGGTRWAAAGRPI